MGGSPDQQEEALTLAAQLAIRNRGDLDKGQALGDADAASSWTSGTDPSAVRDASRL